LEQAVWAAHFEPIERPRGFASPMRLMRPIEARKPPGGK
jgi:hypothetical protein